MTLFDELYIRFYKVATVAELQLSLDSVHLKDHTLRRDMRSKNLLPEDSTILLNYTNCELVKEFKCRPETCPLSQKSHYLFGQFIYHYLQAFSCGWEDLFETVLLTRKSRDSVRCVFIGSLLIYMGWNE